MRDASFGGMWPGSCLSGGGRGCRTWMGRQVGKRMGFGEVALLLEICENSKIVGTVVMKY